MLNADLRGSIKEEEQGGEEERVVRQQSKGSFGKLVSRAVTWTLNALPCWSVRRTLKNLKLFFS